MANQVNNSQLDACVAATRKEVALAKGFKSRLEACHALVKKCTDEQSALHLHLQDNHAKLADCQKQNALKGKQAADSTFSFGTLAVCGLAGVIIGSLARNR